MTIKQAKENIMKNWRANYTADHMDNHDKEVFLLNAMEQLADIAFVSGVKTGSREVREDMASIFLCRSCRDKNKEILDKHHLI